MLNIITIDYLLTFTTETRIRQCYTYGSHILNNYLIILGNIISDAKNMFI